MFSSESVIGMESVAELSEFSSPSYSDKDSCPDVTKFGNYFGSCDCFGSSSASVSPIKFASNNKLINELLPEHLQLPKHQSLLFDSAVNWHQLMFRSSHPHHHHRCCLCGVSCGLANFTSFFPFPLCFSTNSQNAQSEKLKSLYCNHHHHQYRQSNSTPESKEIKNCIFLKSDIAFRLMEANESDKVLHKVYCFNPYTQIVLSSSVKSNLIVVPTFVWLCSDCSDWANLAAADHIGDGSICSYLVQLFQVLTCDSHLNLNSSIETFTDLYYFKNKFYYFLLFSVCQSLIRSKFFTILNMSVARARNGQFIFDYFNSRNNADPDFPVNLSRIVSTTTATFNRSYLQFLIDIESIISSLSPSIITMPCLLSVTESANHQLSSLPLPPSQSSLIQSTSESVTSITNSMIATICRQQQSNSKSSNHLHSLYQSHSNNHKHNQHRREEQIVKINNLNNVRQYCHLLPNENNLCDSATEQEYEQDSGINFLMVDSGVAVVATENPEPTWYQVASGNNSDKKTDLLSDQLLKKFVNKRDNTIQLMFNRAVSNFYVRFVFLLLLICHSQITSVNSSANIRATEKRILDSIIGDGRYDSRIRPMGNATGGARGGDGPAVVYINLLIRSISRIDDVVMEYSVQVTFREQWIDSRLKFDNMSGQIRYLVLTDPNRVWRPDLFFKNEKEGHFHEIIMPNVLLRIYPEGDVLYSIRISLVLACPMNLKYYPLDKQICSIQMASYGYTTEDLMFVWKKDGPVQITGNLHLPRFTLEKYLTDYCTSTTNTGSYSCLKVDLLFKREFSYYLIQIYIPCCMLVIVSWVSFWLDPNAIPARVSLGVTTLLTMATSISGINSSLPPVSYTKAIDVWTGVCLTFVFGALLEFALVNYASRSDAHRAALKQQQAAFNSQRKWDVEHSSAIDGDQIDGRSASAFAMRPMARQQADFHGEKMRACEIHVSLPKRNWCKRWLSKFPTRSKRIDVISRIFFPLMFAMFNLVYWTTYLFREDMQDL